METELAIVQFKLPRWLLAIYAGFAVVLAPWIIFLAYSLPRRHISRHWDLAWVGLDFGLLLSLGLSAYLGLKRSSWITLSAMALGTLLLVDAWFDVLTAPPGHQAELAIVMAVAIELPLAAMSLWLSQKVAGQLVRSSRAE